MTQEEIQKEIFVRVKNVIVESMNADEDEVIPASRILEDLGADSIDQLDIAFRLEREFGIKVPRQEFFPESIFVGDTNSQLFTVQYICSFVARKLSEREKTAT